MKRRQYQIITQDDFLPTKNFINIYKRILEEPERASRKKKFRNVQPSDFIGVSGSDQVQRNSALRYQQNYGPKNCKNYSLSPSRPKNFASPDQIRAFTAESFTVLGSDSFLPKMVAPPDEDHFCHAIKSPEENNNNQRNGFLAQILYQQEQKYQPDLDNLYEIKDNDFFQVKQKPAVASNYQPVTGNNQSVQQPSYQQVQGQRPPPPVPVPKAEKQRAPPSTFISNIIPKEVRRATPPPRAAPPPASRAAAPPTMFNMIAKKADPPFSVPKPPVVEQPVEALPVPKPQESIEADKKETVVPKAFANAAWMQAYLKPAKAEEPPPVMVEPEPSKPITPPARPVGPPKFVPPSLKKDAPPPPPLKPGTVKEITPEPIKAPTPKEKTPPPPPVPTEAEMEQIRCMSTSEALAVAKAAAAAQKAARAASGKQGLAAFGKK